MAPHLAFVFRERLRRALQARHGPRRAHWRERPRLSEETLKALCAAEPDPATASLEGQLAALGSCLDTLAPQARRAVELRYQQAHSVPEAAQRLGCAETSLYTVLYRARNALRECIERKLAEAV